MITKEYCGSIFIILKDIITFFGQNLNQLRVKIHQNRFDNLIMAERKNMKANNYQTITDRQQQQFIGNQLNFIHTKRH